MSFPIYRWLKITLLNLLIVATIGVVLRYKILYPLPFIDQKHLLHGHSHFAFSGWITQAIMTLMVVYLANSKGETIYKRYRWLLYTNLFTAYGMLVAFPIEGYGLYSIIFSSASVLVSYAFAVYYWKDLNKQAFKQTTHLWFKAAVFFNAFSSLGIFALTIMMVSNVIHSTWYLAAEYFYLHFQSNGWFFFACMGLFTAYISRFIKAADAFKKIFKLFVFAAVPAYFLSTLWMPLPVWVYILVIIAAVAQLAGWIWLVNLLKINWQPVKNNFSVIAKYILAFAGIALTVKLLLQLGSTFPGLSDLAFGFRPIVIGYLHLVLLGVITLFLLGYMFAQKYFIGNKTAMAGAFVFSGAVIFNEMLLMIQGVAAITYTAIPFINELLLGAAILLFAGALLMAFAKGNMVKDQMAFPAGKNIPNNNKPD
ncbi:MAG: hypothetical protein IPI54_11570 [Chitinophagaceae bacterium]|nr:hypothetical protein [Chitinophagaceae bacterium]